jgi:hypothetical protein
MEFFTETLFKTLANPGVASVQLLSPHNSRSTRLTVTRVTVEPGATQPRHVHDASEQVWIALSGSGRLLLDGIYGRDYPVVQGAVLVIAFGFVLVNLFVDLLYAVVDSVTTHRFQPRMASTLTGRLGSSRAAPGEQLLAGWRLRSRRQKTPCHTACSGLECLYPPAAAGEAWVRKQARDARRGIGIRSGSRRRSRLGQGPGPPVDRGDHRRTDQGELVGSSEKSSDLCGPFRP